MRGNAYLVGCLIRLSLKWSRTSEVVRGPAARPQVSDIIDTEEFQVSRKRDLPHLKKGVAGLDGEEAPAVNEPKVEAWRKSGAD